MGIGHGYVSISGRRRPPARTGTIDDACPAGDAAYRLPRAVLIPGAAVAETPVIVTGGAAIMGGMLCVDGLYRVSDGNLDIDFSWLQWPF